MEITDWLFNLVNVASLVILPFLDGAMKMVRRRGVCVCVYVCAHTKLLLNLKKRKARFYWLNLWTTCQALKNSNKIVLYKLNGLALHILSPSPS